MCDATFGLQNDCFLLFFAICIPFLLCTDRANRKKGRNPNYWYGAVFLKCIKMKQVNTTNSKANNMFMDEWRLFTEEAIAAATTTTCTNTHKYQHLIPINNATEREKHEINNFQRENWIWGVKNTNDANTNDDISQMCCMRERIFHKEEAWNIHVWSKVKNNNNRYSQTHTCAERKYSLSRTIFNWIIVYRWIIHFQIESFWN